MENSGPIKTRGKKVSIRITEVVQVAATHHTIVPVHILRITGSEISLTLITNKYMALEPAFSQTCILSDPILVEGDRGIKVKQLLSQDNYFSSFDFT